MIKHCFECGKKIFVPEGKETEHPLCDECQKNSYGVLSVYELKLGGEK